MLRKRDCVSAKRSRGCVPVRFITSVGRASAPIKSIGQRCPALDKAIQKGVLHENTASRYKSRLSKRLRRVEVGTGVSVSAEKNP